MAVEAVVALMVDKLDKLLSKEAQLLGVHGEINWIREELDQMRRFLKDADIKQKEDEDVRDWMEDIRDICFDVDDVIDILGQGQAAQERHGFVERLKRRISDQITRYKVSKEIERIKLSIKGIKRSREPYGIREINEERQEATSSTQLLQEAKPEKKEIVSTTVDDQLTNEERTRDIDEGRQEASPSSRNLPAHRRVSPLPGEPEVGLQEENNTVGQQLIDEPRLWDGTRDIDEGRQEASPSSQSLQDRRQFSALFEEPKVYGQDNENEFLLHQLVNGEPRRRVISIFGMGGSGKTTLVRNVYNDERARTHFHCRAFICLSQQYELKDVLIRVIACVMGESRTKGIENLPKEILGRMLRDDLSDKRYLVVIDDIWSIEAWDMLELILPKCENGSRVMLTTRIKDVAVYAADSVSSLHEMRLLNDDYGWILFRRKAFSGGETPPSELEEIGKKIIAKCGGLPLAIVDLGGLLARKEKTVREWLNVLNCVPRHLIECSKWCMKILALSYSELPNYLKPCFLYLGLFPEDYEISSDILVSLWIAEGFIKQRDSEIMEAVAEDYLEKLVSRSMLQVVAKKSNGLVDKCRVHVLLRDLSIFEAGRNNFFTIYKDNGTSSSSTSVTRLAFHGNVNGYETSKISTESLRSILYFPDSEVPLSKLLNTRPKLLRVLKTDHVDFSKVTLPKDIGDFVHLRYLEIGGREPPLPPSIGDLYNLQILIVRGVATLPNAIFNLKQLRHLQAWFSAIDGHPRLENLRNLCYLCLEAGSWMEDGLDKLTNLRELIINGCIGPYAKTVCDSIEKLHNLQRLVLEFGDSSPTFMPFTGHLDLYEMSLKGSIGKLPELPPNLVKLTLTGSRLQEDAISTLEKLSNLKILWLGPDSYICKKMICSRGGFPRLESLTLLQLSIEELIVEKGAMPVIKSVGLNGLPNLSKRNLPSLFRYLLQAEAEDDLVKEAEDDLAEEAEDEWN